ncbi:MAG: pyruvate kinase [Vicinamibacterales bacterium]
MRHTKIVATVGPASESDAVLRDLVKAGVDVFRLNFSHGSRERHGAVIARIRRLAGDARRSIAILQDLGGPKIRTGALVGGMPIELEAGDQLFIGVGDFEGTKGRVSTPYEDLPRSVRPGDSLLLDDGRLQLRVQDSTATELRAVVVDGGPLGEHKGISAPGVPLPAAGLTAKDAEDLAFGIEAGVDLVALSFVLTAADMRQARDAVMRLGKPAMPLIAKLERPEAIAHLGEIIAESDAVMVARGDLGLEIPLERVPRVQKEITRKARAAGVPVIVATQVLESMRTEPRPTRAEVSDAANAVDDGVDAIMLSGETAVGAYPVRAVLTLDAVIRDAEIVSPSGEPAGRRRLSDRDGVPILAGHGRAICQAAVTLAELGEASAIVAVTRGGKTARVLSAMRPRAPILAATDRPDIARRLSLFWGVEPHLVEYPGEGDTPAIQIGETLVARGAVPPGSVLVLVSVNPDLTHVSANFLKLQRF